MEKLNITFFVDFFVFFSFNISTFLAKCVFHHEIETVEINVSHRFNLINVPQHFNDYVYFCVGQANGQNMKTQFNCSFITKPISLFRWQRLILHLFQLLSSFEKIYRFIQISIKIQSYFIKILKRHTNLKEFAQEHFNVYKITTKRI